MRIHGLAGLGWTRPILCLAGALGLASCVDGGNGGNDAGETGAGETGDGMADTGADEGDGGRPAPGPPAAGIAITHIYANQGIRVPVAAGADWVGADGRTAPLVKNRNTLMRVMVDVEDGWVPHEIVARITFYYEDGATEVGDMPVIVEEDSTDGRLASSINFYVPADRIRPSMGFQVELFDTDDSRADEPPFGPTASPAEPDLLGVEASDLGIDVVVVPIEHDLGDTCPDPPEPDEVDLERMSAFLKNYNPVSEVNVRVGPTLTYDKGTTSSFDGLLNFMAQAREGMTDAPTHEYWYGVIRLCDAGPEIPNVGPTGGQAIAINDIAFVDDPSLRISMGRWSENTNNSPDGEPHVSTGALDIYVHEIGHCQGRAHAPCAAPGADNNYPYPDADIGTYGYSELTNAYYEPNQNVKDYMSYCDPVFVSDYTYRGVLPFIRALSGMKNAAIAPDPADAPGGALLVGLIDDTGAAHWHTSRGHLPADRRLDAVAELAGLDAVAGRPATVLPRGEGQGATVVVELEGDGREDLARLMQLTVDLPEGRRTFDGGAIVGEIQANRRALATQLVRP